MIHNALIAEINRLTADVESLDSESQRLQYAINRSDTAIIDEMLLTRDVTELKKLEDACQALQAAGDKHSELLQQIVSGVAPLQALVDALEGPAKHKEAKRVWELADVFNKMPLSERSVLHHLGDLEAFCVRVQVALQRRERERMEENVSKRRLTSDGKDNHGEEAEDDEGAEQFGAEKDVQPPVASKQRVVAVAASAKAPSPQLKISIPDIRDDDDAYFGDCADTPMESNVLRTHVLQARQRRGTLASASQVDAAGVAPPPAPLSPSRVANPAAAAATPKSIPNSKPNSSKSKFTPPKSYNSAGAAR